MGELHIHNIWRSQRFVCVGDWGGRCGCTRDSIGAVRGFSETVHPIGLAAIFLPSEEPICVKVPVKIVEKTKEIGCFGGRQQLCRRGWCRGRFLKKKRLQRWVKRELKLREWNWWLQRCLANLLRYEPACEWGMFRHHWRVRDRCCGRCGECPRRHLGQRNGCRKEELSRYNRYLFGCLCHPLTSFATLQCLHAWRGWHNPTSLFVIVAVSLRLDNVHRDYHLDS